MIEREGGFLIVKSVKIIINFLYRLLSLSVAVSSKLHGFPPWSRKKASKNLRSALRMLMGGNAALSSLNKYTEKHPSHTTPPNIFKTLLAGLLCCCALGCGCPRHRNEEQTPSDRRMS